MCKYSLQTYVVIHKVYGLIDRLPDLRTLPINRIIYIFMPLVNNTITFINYIKYLKFKQYIII